MNTFVHIIRSQLDTGLMTVEDLHAGLRGDNHCVRLSKTRSHTHDCVWLELAGQARTHIHVGLSQPRHSCAVFVRANLVAPHRSTIGMQRTRASEYATGRWMGALHVIHLSRFGGVVCADIMLWPECYTMMNVVLFVYTLEQTDTH